MSQNIPTLLCGSLAALAAVSVLALALPVLVDRPNLWRASGDRVMLKFFPAAPGRRDPLPSRAQF